jgi:hypothetical protein
MPPHLRVSSRLSRLVRAACTPVPHLPCLAVALSSCAFSILATFPAIAQRIVVFFGRPCVLLVCGGLANLSQGCHNGRPTVKITVRTSACVRDYPVDAVLPADGFLPSADAVHGMFKNELNILNLFLMFHMNFNSQKMSLAI